MLIAITREVSPSIGNCELTYLERQAIDLDLACSQHQEYEHALRELDCEVRRLPAEPDLPDAVFIEDTALVLDELAIMARPGAASRRPELRSIAQALEPYRELVSVEAPGTLDGGDILRIGKTLYIGLSSRTNLHAVEQIRVALAPYGYHVASVPVSGCLHLKSAVTQVATDTLLINRDWVDPRAFGDMRLIDVDQTEPFGGNALLIGDTVIYPTSYPKTQKRLEAHGIAVRTVDASEFIKAEGGVTCSSLVFNERS